MKQQWRKLLIYGILYILIIHITLSVFSTFAAYTNLKEEYVSQVKQQEESVKTNKPIIFVGSNNEEVSTLFGPLKVSFPTHCYSSAESYFNAHVNATKFISIFLCIVLSVFLFTFFKSKKIPLNVLSIFISALLISVIAFLAVQLWINSSSNIKDYSLKSFTVPCF